MTTNTLFALLNDYGFKTIDTNTWECNKKNYIVQVRYNASFEVYEITEAHDNEINEYSFFSRLSVMKKIKELL